MMGHPKILDKKPQTRVTFPDDNNCGLAQTCSVVVISSFVVVVVRAFVRSFVPLFGSLFVYLLCKRVGLSLL